jgi:ABC-2 type transport system ATP-binding protein
MISIEQLNFGYSKNQRLLENIELNLSAGSICGLLGKNGVGKTTLLYQIVGLLFPKSGTVNCNGFNPKDRLPIFLEDIYFLPEEFETQKLSIRKFGEYHGAFYPKFDRSKFYSHLESFELDESMHFNKISFGQQKKAMISFAVATNASLLILDEPTNGLDISSKTVFRKILASEINEERLFLISTHQVNDLENLIDQIIIMGDKKILLNASMKQIEETLIFKDQLQEEDDVLFEIKTLFGKSGIVKNHINESHRIDLESLFEFVCSQPQKVEKLFSN